MDWTLAIERNTVALKRIVATLVGMAGFDAPSLLPLWEKVSPSGERSEQEEKRRMRGVGRIADFSDPSSTPHPTSPALRSSSATFSHKGRMEGPTLPRRLHRAVLRLLRPAESAVRRLIVIAARGLVVPPSPVRVREPTPPSIFVRNRRGTGIILPRGAMTKPARPAPRSISLALFDPLKRPYRRHRPTPVCEPRISYPGPFNRLSPVKLRQPPSPDDRLDATRLALRINALAAALDDLPRQAHRLARWRANRDAAFLAPLGVRRTGETSGSPRNGAEPGGEAAASEAESGFRATPQVKARRRHRRLSPLRPGRPPGFSRRLDTDLRDLLTDVHGLAHDVLEHPDTS